MNEEMDVQQEEELDLEIFDDDELDEDKPRGKYDDLSPEELKEQLEKAEKAIIESKRRSKKSEKTLPKRKEEDIPEWGKKMLEADEKRNFGYQNNLSPEQVDALYRYGGGSPDKELMERPEVKAMLKALSDKERVERNTPRSSGSGAAVYKGKPASEVIGSDAPAGEKQSAFNAIKRKHGLN